MLDTRTRQPGQLRPPPPSPEHPDPMCPLTSSSMVAAISASPSRLRQGKALSTVSTAQRQGEGADINPGPKRPPCPPGPKYPLWLLMSQRPPRYPTTSLRVRWLWKSWGGDGQRESGSGCGPAPNVYPRGQSPCHVQGPPHPPSSFKP